MPKKKTPVNNKKANSSAAWKLTILFLVFGSITFGLLWWARTDAESQAAKSIRQLTGIVLIGAPAPTPAPEPVAPVIAPVIEPEPVDVVVEDHRPPEPTKLEWSAFRNQPEMWPDSLQIMVDKQVTLTYRGKSFGEVEFTSGQLLNAKDFSENGFVSGRTGGSEMEVHISATNFSEWFNKEHGNLHVMTYPEKQVIQQADDYEDELITKLRIWAMQNYNTPLVEINENNLVLHLHNDDAREANTNYAPEAMSVARAYLRIQGNLGGTDNYASCEIRDPKTGELLGANGIFIPKL